MYMTPRLRNSLAQLFRTNSIGTLPLRQLLCLRSLDSGLWFLLYRVVQICLRSLRLLQTPKLQWQHCLACRVLPYCIISQPGVSDRQAPISVLIRTDAHFSWLETHSDVLMQRTYGALHDVQSAVGFGSSTTIHQKVLPTLSDRTFEQPRTIYRTTTLVPPPQRGVSVPFTVAMSYPEGN
jgi:hypothetical protein